MITPTRAVQGQVQATDARHILRRGSVVVYDPEKAAQPTPFSRARARPRPRFPVPVPDSFLPFPEWKRGKGKDGRQESGTGKRGRARGRDQRGGAVGRPSRLLY